MLSGQDTARRPIVTAVPFLMISPDSRGSAMGETGVATDADVNSIHWNNAKLAFIDKKYGFGLSYVPWLGKIVDDMSISYLTVFLLPSSLSLDSIVIAWAGHTASQSLHAMHLSSPLGYLLRACSPLDLVPKDPFSKG